MGSLTSTWIPFPPPSIQPRCTAVQSAVSWNRLSICQIPQRIASSCLRRVESHYQTKGITSLQIGGTRWLHMWLCIPGTPATPARCKPPLILTLTLHNGNLCGIQKGRGRQTKEIISLIWRWLVIRVVLLIMRKLRHPLEQYIVRVFLLCWWKLVMKSLDGLQGLVLSCMFWHAGPNWLQKELAVGCCSSSHLNL